MRAAFLKVVLPLGLALLAASLATNGFAQQGDDVQVELNIASAQPRQVEDTTEKAIVRDYTRAWRVLSRALDSNQPGLLDTGFVGVARDKFAAAIEGQREAGVRTRYVDKGHKLEAVFYSPEGSAMQLRDTAQMELQVLDGDTVIHREDVTLRYIVLMTVAEADWKVRVLEQVENF